LLPSAGQAPPAAPAAPAGAEPRGGNESILLVEDDDAVRKFTLFALSSLGYRVLPAKDGPSALELLQRAPQEIDLLVTDVVMPEMSGPLLAEILRVKFPDVRVLFVSGYADDAIVERGLLQSTSAFLHKPFAPQSLASKVREVLDET
jgi:CheY-like chemotaxis protein